MRKELKTRLLRVASAIDKLPKIANFCEHEVCVGNDEDSAGIRCLTCKSPHVLETGNVHYLDDPQHSHHYTKTHGSPMRGATWHCTCGAVAYLRAKHAVGLPRHWHPEEKLSSATEAGLKRVDVILQKMGLVPIKDYALHQQADQHWSIRSKKLTKDSKEQKAIITALNNLGMQAKTVMPTYANIWFIPSHTKEN